LRAARDGEPIDRFLTRLGIAAAAEPEDSESTRSTLPTPLESERTPLVGGYVCPMGACTPVERREADAELPACEIHEQALRFSAGD
ncbi:hypothetical protein JYK22_37565, partial [Nonomuraea sp. RK-328]|nr:hypothetical protein [Nonomuraea sp. RK-328]